MPHLTLYEYEITDLVRRLLQSPGSLEESFSGLLNYRFAFRLQQLRVKPSRVIDWFENQPVDKGWNLGFSRFLPDVHTIGYQGSFAGQPRDQLTSEEILVEACPREVRVMGRALMPPDTRFGDKKIKWSISPAFRYEWLARHRISPEERISDNSVILVLLPIETLTARYIVDCVAETVDLLGPGIQLQIKPHPASSRVLLEYCKSINKDNFEVLPDVLNLRDNPSRVVICGGISTTSLEVLSIGKKLVYVEVPGYRYQTPRLEIDAGDSFICVKNATELTSVLKRESLWRQSGEAASIAEQVKHLFFEPVTRRGIGEFVA